MLTLLTFAAFLAALIYRLVIKPLFIDCRGKIPGPKIYALTRWSLALEDWRGARTRHIDQLHQRYGSIVRIGPNEVHCNSLSALRTIYGAGSGFERTIFYRMFDAYGRQNLFTFHSVREHSQRKKLVANAYSKSLMLKGPAARMIQSRVEEYLALIEAQATRPHEIFTSLHYFSLDTITHFLYGSSFGGTSAVTGDVAHRRLLNDIVDPARRHLSWFAVHLPAFTKWLYTRTGRLETLIRPTLPMQKPATYTGIREHAMKAVKQFQVAVKTDPTNANIETTILSRLWKYHGDGSDTKEAKLDTLDIASECADHLLAGIDTTADTLMFLIWALSRPQNAQHQHSLIDEVRTLPDHIFTDGVPDLEAIDALPVLNAVIRETLRLYAPLPASEPRSLSTDCIIDGYTVPAGTVVSMSPYSLHRNEAVFPDPHVFNPGRWLDPTSDIAVMNRWFWAFSSGGRMCIGLHLAMAEMTALVVAVYRSYSTAVSPGFEDKSPAITSRFELFYDVLTPQIEEHKCMISFKKHAT